MRKLIASGTLAHTKTKSAPHITDKVDHGYLPAYERHLPSRVTRFMEIGVGREAGGLKMFRDYYEGKGEFHALDLFGNGVVSEDELRSEGFITHRGSQSDLEFLKTIPSGFDFIVEDGSHHSDEQIITFKHCFVHNVQPGGCYALEDLCCCRDSYWWRGVVDGYDNTFLAIIKRVIAGGEFTSQLITKEESDELIGVLEHASLECEDGGCIAFMRKKI